MAIVGVALVFAAAVYAFAKGEGGGADLFITDLIGGAASSIVVFGATAGVYLMLRNWRAKRRILANLMRSSREPAGHCPAVIEPLARRLTAGAGDDALVTVDALPVLTSVVRGLRYCEPYSYWARSGAEKAHHLTDECLSG